MRFTFVTLAAMAAAAFAAPATRTTKSLSTTLMGSDGVSHEFINTLDAPFKIEVAIQSADELVGYMVSSVDSVKINTEAIKATVAQVQSGTMTKEEAKQQASQQLKEINAQLSNIVSTLLGARTNEKAKGDNLDRLLECLVELICTIFSAIECILSILGIDGPLEDILNSVFGLLANVVCALVEIVQAIIPGVIKALVPLLSALGEHLLAPLLQAVADILRALLGWN